MPELHNLLNLLQHTEFTWFINSTSWQFFHPLAGFGEKFSHRVSHRPLPAAMRNQLMLKTHVCMNKKKKSPCIFIPKESSYAI
jgi:hypothetical protein